MGKMLVLGFIGTWLGVFFGVMDANGWFAVACASVAAMGWNLLWLTVAMVFDL